MDYIFDVLDLFLQDNVGRHEVDAADCKTVYLSEYAITSLSKDLQNTLFHHL